MRQIHCEQSPDPSPSRAKDLSFLHLLRLHRSQLRGGRDCHSVARASNECEPGVSVSSSLEGAAGFFCIAWLTQRFFRGAEGSGIPQTIFALRADAGETGLRLLRPHLVLGRIFLAAVSVGTLTGGLSYGSGYAQARSILEAHVHLPWLYAPGRALATLLS